MSTHDLSPRDELATVVFNSLYELVPDLAEVKRLGERHRDHPASAEIIAHCEHLQRELERLLNVAGEYADCFEPRLDPEYRLAATASSLVCHTCGHSTSDGHVHRADGTAVVRRQ
jgi:hypothetical protein